MPRSSTDWGALGVVAPGFEQPDLRLREPVANVPGGLARVHWVPKQARICACSDNPKTTTNGKPTGSVPDKQACHHATALA